MKNKDYFMIALVAGLSLLISVFFSKFFISGESNRNLTAEVVQPINSEFIAAPEKYFNSKSVNPTQIIRISPENAGNPFGQ